MRDALLVGVGGFAGAVARYLLGGALLAASGQDRIPVGTLVVNVLGCALAGAFVAASERMPGLDGPMRLLVATGVLGGFTTFSAFGIETLAMLRRGDVPLAVAYAGGSLVLGLLAAWAGLRLVALLR